MLVEKLARLENFYENKMESQNSVNINFVISCREKLKEIKQELSSAYPVIVKTFEDKPISSEETENFLTVYKKCLDKFLELHSLSSQLPLNAISSETYIFLSEVLKVKKSFQELDSRIVLLTQDFLTRNTHKCLTNLPFISDIEKKPMALYIPIIENSNPLYWPLLVKNIFGNIEKLKAVAKNYYEELIGPKVKDDEEKRKVTEKLAFQLTYDLFSMKLLGPAYYYLFTEIGVFRSIAETKIRYLPTLAVREKILFDQLKNSNLADKAEDTHNWFITLSSLSDEMSFTLGLKTDVSDIKEELNTLVEKINEEADNVIAQKNTFRCNDFCTSLAGFERLKRGALIASSTSEEINESKKHCLNHICETGFSEKTEQHKELPNSPQQIINAGWIYNEYINDEILRKVIENKNLDYAPFIEHIKNKDGLLLNSVEKSKIFEFFQEKEE